jgi:hypothetical protein
MLGPSIFVGVGSARVTAPGDYPPIIVSQRANRIRQEIPQGFVLTYHSGQRERA